MTTKTKKAIKRKKLTRARFNAVALKDLCEKWLYVEEWDSEVLLRAVSMDTLFDIRERNAGAEKDDKEFGMLLLSKCLIDPDTDMPMFSFDEIDTLKERSVGAIVQLINAVNEINGLSEEVKKVTDAASSQTANGPTPSS